LISTRASLWRRRSTAPTKATQRHSTQRSRCAKACIGASEPLLLIEILFRARRVAFEFVHKTAIMKRPRIFRVELNGMIKIGKRAVIVYDHVSDPAQIIEIGLRWADGDSLIHILDGVAIIVQRPIRQGAAIEDGRPLGGVRVEAQPLPPSILKSSCLLHVLGWRCVSLRLQPVQIIGGLLRVAGGGEDRPLIVFQDFQPTLNIGGVVVAGFRRDAKIGASKSCADFGDKSSMA